MTPTILALIVLALVAADFFLDLQLFGLSTALSVSVTSVVSFFGAELLYWQWSLLFVACMLFFVWVTRYWVKQTDNNDINHY